MVGKLYRSLIGAASALFFLIVSQPASQCPDQDSMLHSSNGNPKLNILYRQSISINSECLLKLLSEISSEGKKENLDSLAEWRENPAEWGIAHQN